MILEVWEACYLSRIIVGKPFLQTLRMTVYYRRWRLGKRWRQRKGPAFIRYKYCDCTGNHIRKRARMHPNTKYKWKIKGILWPNPWVILGHQPLERLQKYNLAGLNVRWIRRYQCFILVLPTAGRLVHPCVSLQAFYQLHLDDLGSLVTFVAYDSGVTFPFIIFLSKDFFMWI